MGLQTIASMPVWRPQRMFLVVLENKVSIGCKEQKNDRRKASCKKGNQRRLVKGIQCFAQH